MMSQNDKAEMLKDTIVYLYNKEGRSKSYISRLLNIGRHVISGKIAEWDIQPAEPRRHAKPSTQKFINRNRTKIKSMLDRDITLTEIAEELKASRDVLETVFLYDDVLRKSRDDYLTRLHNRGAEKKQGKKDESSREYDFPDLEGEKWRSILGYARYQISNMGRVKRYAERCDSYYLIHPAINTANNRLYIRIVNDKGESKNIQLSRVVAFTFVPGHSDERNTVNHINGDVSDCRAKNLEWTSQGKNDLHAYRKPNKSVVRDRRYRFKKIIYNGKYEFKTIAALSRFLGISETQTRRWLDHPEKHNLILIGDCND